jgi:hypothetical protein
MTQGEGAGPWEASWEVEFPAADPRQLLLCLVVRDLVHGSSYDFELAEPGSTMAVDYVAGDELQGDGYRLILTARVEGSDDRQSLQLLTEEVLEEAISESESLVEASRQLGSLPLEQLVFEVVAEDGERWDLVVPDWLAPDGAEVPFGFRPVVAATGACWPSDEDLDDHGRIVLVPHAGNALLFAIPSPADEVHELPVVR